MPSNSASSSQNDALETQMYNRGVTRFRKKELGAVQSGKQYTTAAGISMTKRLISPLSQAIDAFLEESLSGKPGRRAVASKYLNQLPSEQLAYITCRAVFDTISQTSPLTSLSQKLGRLIEDECQLNAFEKALPQYYFHLYSSSAANLKRRKIFLRQAMAHKGIEWEPWTFEVRVLVGSKLIEFFQETSGLIRFFLQAESSHRNPKSRWVVQATPEALEFIQEKNKGVEGLKPVYGAILEPPAPWKDIQEGGYHTLPLTLVKTYDKEHLDLFKDWKMPKVYKAVNALQETPYEINKKVYEVMRQMVDQGIALAGLPDAYDRDQHEGTGWGKESFETYRRGQILLNKHLEIAMVLKEAESYLKAEPFYFVHTLDFRGRAYPVTSYLSPQGNDLNRGLLTFAKGEAKPLGNDGACWLAIHGANCWGQKGTLQERIDWILDHSKEILNCVTDPLDESWWTEAGDPFQFLAFCFEWEGYEREGINYKCSLPVAVDGANNALQHYSALLLDPELAKMTNVLPSDQPQDLYQEVCDEVNRLIDEDAREEIKEAQQWQGHVKRSDVKRPVMTYCYGATPYGIKRMVREDTLKPWRDSNKPWPSDYEGRWAADYLGKTIEKALTHRIFAAETCMKWLQEIGQKFGERHLPVRWITPVGFPVLNKYPRYQKKNVKTQLNGNLRLKIRKATDEINVMQQKNALSANFVHSLDAAAMMLTVNQALENGIKCFRMIHDSYAVMPSDLPMMRVCLRETFYEMYAENNLLELFLKDAMTILKETDEEIEVDNPPQKGDLDLKKVLDSDYFFA